MNLAEKLWLGLSKKVLFTAFFLLPNFAVAQVNHELGKDSAICQNLSQRMQQVSANTTIETIHEINRQLKNCVKSANNQQLLIWLNQHTQMYEAFTTLPDQSDAENDIDSEFFAMAQAYENNGKVDINQFKNLSPRAKYLAKQLGTSEIILYNQGEGYYNFWYKLPITVDIFTPYLPKDQAVYLKRLAQESQEAFFMDAGITWTYQQLIDSGLFWENFIKTYPNSEMIKSAKVHYLASQYYLFFGSDNTQWVDDAMHKMYADKDLHSLQRLAKLPNSDFGKRANVYLEFLHMTPAQRDKKYPINKLDDSDSPKNSWQITREQLKKALAPLSEDFDNVQRDFDNCISFSTVCSANKQHNKNNEL